jgi:hypothetical protein
MIVDRRLESQGVWDIRRMAIQRFFNLEKAGIAVLILSILMIFVLLYW